MSSLLLLSREARPLAEVLPALDRLPLDVHVRRACQGAALPADVPGCKAVLVDACVDLAGARELCRSMCGRTEGRPLIAVFTDGGLIALDPTWGVDDVVLQSAEPEEIAMRLRLASGPRPALQSRRAQQPPDEPMLDDEALTLLLCGRRIRLTYAEHQILTRLASRPGQVFTHRQLWESYGTGNREGTGTVRTHIRRIRAKLGPDAGSLIQTRRNLGYVLESDPAHRPPTWPDAAARHRQTLGP